MKSHRDIINLWGSVADFARDIAVGYEAASKMKKRNSIAAHHWQKIVEVCREKHELTQSDKWDGVTLQLLAALQPPKASKYQAADEDHSATAA